MFKTTKGLILREVKYKEADRILTVLTEDMGKITVKARGALRKGSKTAATGLLTKARPSRNSRGFAAISRRLLWQAILPSASRPCLTRISPTPICCSLF